MSGLNIRAPHPFKHLTPPPGRQISPSAALAHIQTYLEQTRTAAHLHPDAIFSEAGITFTSAAATGGVALHQLRRVEKGLQGVWLGRDVELEWMGDEDGRGDAAEVLDYQAQLRELGEGIVEGEIGDRNNAVRDGGKETVVSESRKRGFEEMQDGDTLVIDKEARKRAKAERRKKEKKEKHKEREGKAREQRTADVLDEIPDADLIINGTVHDETRDEYDDAAPSAAYLPEKISSTVTKTRKEVHKSLKNGLTSLERHSESQTATQNQNHNDVDDRDASHEEPDAPQTAVRKEDSKEKKEKKKRDDTKAKSRARSQTSPESSESLSQKTQLTNGDARGSKSRKHKSAKSQESRSDYDSVREHTPQVQVPSSYDGVSTATPARNVPAVVKDTPPSKMNGDKVFNGYLALLDQSSEGEDGGGGGGKEVEDAEARAQRKADKRQRKEDRRARRAAKEKRRAERQSKKEKKVSTAESQ